GLDDLHSGLEELEADDQRHHAADAEEEERADKVHVPDRLVVRRRDPVDDDLALSPWNHGSVKGRLIHRGGHCSAPSFGYRLRSRSEPNRPTLVSSMKHRVCSVNSAV